MQITNFNLSSYYTNMKQNRTGYSDVQITRNKNTTISDVQYPQNSSEFVLLPDVDTYKSSFLEAAGPEELSLEEFYQKIESINLQNTIKHTNDIWEKAKAEYGDDLFRLYGGAQNEVFSQKMQEIGCFDGMSKEESGRLKGLLSDITKVLNHVNVSPYGIGSKGYRSPMAVIKSDSGDDICKFYSDYDDNLFRTWSDEAKMELESSTAALQYFTDKYVDAEHREEFYSLINDYHTHNAEYLKNYYTFEEGMIKSSQQLIASGVLERMNSYNTGALSQKKVDYFRYMGSITHTEKDTKTYMKNLAAIFKKMQQTGTDYTGLWDQLKDEHLGYLTKNTAIQDYKDREWNRAESTFDLMKDYWSKLLEN